MLHWHRALFFFSSRRRHTRSLRDWSSDVCSSDLEGRFNLCRASQSLFQDGGLDGELVRIVGVLVMTPAAALEVRTSRFDSIRRRLDHAIETRPRESRLL